MAERADGIWRSALLLATVAVLGTALLSGVHELTADRIAEQERRVVLEQLNQVLPAGRYDNELLTDRVTVRDAEFFPDDQAVTVYRARRAGEPVALILRHRAVNGYNGDIRLLTGIANDGRITGVRVTRHGETPGLGDAIEIEKSDWIRGFDGRALGDPPADGWRVRRDGGVFDQFTGATITPRAVVGAVHAALQYVERNRAKLFSLPAETGEERIEQ
ncbi:MAG: electron transport complex subunit RsxG [Xanthomonadales bacterium]